MSTNIPSADTALLHAQAKAGPAGVEAYEQAKKELAAQQAAAAAAAQAEAARRGTPDAALGVASAGLNDMYARRLASMTEAGALAGAQAEQRDARMADYSGAVGQARGLIADQVQQTIAPINAETDYRIKALTREGQNAVDKIEAQMRLDAARAAFEEANRGGRGGGGGGGGGGSSSKGKLNDGDLQAMLQSGGQSKMQRARDTAAAAVQATRKVQSSRAHTAANTQYSPQQMMRMGDRAGLAKRQLEKKESPYVAPDRSATAAAYGQPGAASRSQAALEAARRQISTFDRMTAGRNRAIQQAAPLAADPNRSMISPGHLAALGNSSLGALYGQLFGSGQPIRSAADIDRVFMGDPFAISPADQRRVNMSNAQSEWNALTGNGRAPSVPMPGRRDVPGTAYDALQEAMILSAIDLQNEGYDVTEPEVRNALSKVSGNYYDETSTARGGLTGQEQVDLSRDQMAEANKASETNQDEAVTLVEQEERDAFTSATGLDSAKYAQRPDQLVEIIASPTFTAALEAVQGKQWKNRDAIVNELVKNDLRLSDPYERTIIQIVADMMNV